MEIVLHIGPHKTGTTSVQTCLLDRYGSPEPTLPVWYPEPLSFPPGHAQIAQDILNGCKPSSLQITVNTANKAGVEKLILSSELFGAAYPDKLDRLKPAFRGHNLQLMVTLNAPALRAPSLWQELVRHGYTDDLQTGIRHLARSHPSLAPDLVTRFHQTLKPQRCSLIFISRSDDPDLLIRRVSSAAGVTLTGAPRCNRSTNAVEATLMRNLNVAIATYVPGIPRSDFIAVRETLRLALHSAVGVSDQGPTEIIPPETVQCELDELNHQTLRSLETFCAREHPEIFGDIYSILETKNGRQAP